MSAFSVSDLLNPAPLSRQPSPDLVDHVMDEAPSTGLNPDMFVPEFFSNDAVTDTPNIFEQQGLLPMEHSSSPEFMRKDSVATDNANGGDNMDNVGDDGDNADTPAKKKDRSTKQRDLERLKDTKHSSKNEGQHTDRRYLCYICNKLFTRRRSVRDHINKIHGEKMWEPTKSLEIVVEPHTGEPLEPLEEIIARGFQYPSTAEKKSAKSSKARKKEDDLDTDIYAETGEEKPRRRDAEDSTEPEKQSFLLDPSLDLENSLDPRTTIDPLPELPFETTHEDDLNFDPEPEVDAEPAQEIDPVKMVKTRSQSESRPTSAEPTQPPAQVIGKKRPLSATKKGTAKIKSSTPNKRPKIVDSERSTPARSPSVTPAQRLGSKLKNSVHLESPSSRASSRQASPTPTPSIATPASSNDDGEIFCLCRKGDNHTWMIACDGPCEEWFHGKCIGIKERDGELIDKYICPRCEKDGYITTWKRMCRRQGCRKPAKVKDDPPSKYCSRECGKLFFVRLITEGDEDAEVSKDGQHILEGTKKKKLRKKVRKEKPSNVHNGHGTQDPGASRPHTPAYSEEDKSEYETDTSADEADLPNRGGALRAGEVKALTLQCRTIEAWRALGRKPQTPPREITPNEIAKLPLDEFEQVQLDHYKFDHVRLTAKLKFFYAREKMTELINVRSRNIVEEVKKVNPKQKDICGYDPRISMNEEEFQDWYKAGGKEAIESGRIGSPDDIVVAKDQDARDGKTEVSLTDEEKVLTLKGGVCIKNKCNKHNPSGRKWVGSDMRELKFEIELTQKALNTIEREEQRIRARAQMRGLEIQGSLLGHYSYKDPQPRDITP